MRAREITVPKYEHNTQSGTIIVPNVEVLIDLDEIDVTSEEFNQKKHPHYLSASEIERIESFLK